MLVSQRVSTREEPYGNVKLRDDRTGEKFLVESSEEVSLGLGGEPSTEIPLVKRV